MGMLLATLGFFAITAVTVWLHLRRQAAQPQAQPALTGPPCLRCQAPVPAESEFCPGCGISLLVYEIVGAPAVAAEEQDGEEGSNAHAVVRADVCVGCGTCVPACTIKDAIVMQGKLAVVNNSLCKGVGKCVEACPVGAIMLATGGAVQRVEVPEVGPDFQTNLQGVYIAGELGGRGLIKNAINEGKLAAVHVVKELPPGEAREDEDDEAKDLIIVGSGPAGLSTGLEALRSGLSYIILEQGSLADTIRKYPRNKILLAEPIQVPLYGDLWVADGAKETLLGIWETIVANTGLDVRTNHRVDNITREGSLLHLHVGDKVFKGRRVVLALGRRGTPRRLGVKGEELSKVFYDVVEMEAFQNRQVVVVGGGDSAVESALGMANQEGAHVVLSYRGEAFKRVKDRNREKLEVATQEGKLELLLKSQIREIRESDVVMDVEGKERILPNDNVVIRVGGHPPFPFLEQIGVRMIKKDLPLPDEKEKTEEKTEEKTDA